MTDIIKEIFFQFKDEKKAIIDYSRLLEKIKIDQDICICVKDSIIEMLEEIIADETKHKGYVKKMYKLLKEEN